MKERCWEIEEKQPLRPKLDRENKCLTFPAMTLSYSTYEDLIDDSLHTPGLTSYDYEDGKCEMYWTDLDEMRKWAADFPGVISLNI